MYEDTCQMKKRKQISSMRKRYGRQPRQGERQSKEETNWLLETQFGRVTCGKGEENICS